MAGKQQIKEGGQRYGLLLQYRLPGLHRRPATKVTTTLGRVGHKLLLEGS